MGMISKLRSNEIVESISDKAIYFLKHRRLADPWTLGSAPPNVNDLPRRTCAYEAAIGCESDDLRLSLAQLDRLTNGWMENA